MADENIVPLEQCKEFINTNYVSKLLAFLSGSSLRVTTHAEYMKVYSLIIWQCDSNDSNEQINMIFQEFAEEYLQNQVLPKIQNKNGEQLLTNLVEVWHNYNIYSKMMDRSFDYLNRYYLKNSELKMVGETCSHMFHEQIYTQERKRAITDAILEQITADRLGNAINKETVKKNIQVFVDLGLIKPKPMRDAKQNVFYWAGDRNLSVYDDFFEAQFLVRTQKESLQAATLWNSNKSCPEYLTAVQSFLQNEEANADFWLQTETKSKMLKIVELELITKMAEAVSSKDTGCVYMFQQKNLDELKLLYEIFKRDTNTFGLIIQKMTPYILDRGSKIVMDENNVKDPHMFTEKLLDFKREIDELVEYSFSNTMIF